MNRRSTILAVVMVGLCLAFTPARTRGDERHFVLVFGAQPQPKVIKYSHTWATFVRVVDDAAAPGGVQLFAHTLSFYPASLNVRPLALHSEPGANLDLPTTLALMRQNNARTTVWGPFLMRPPVYQKSLEIWAQFSSGAIDYRAIDTFARDVDDCIHAVTAVDPDYGRGHYPLIRVGKSASRYIARQVVKRIDPDRALPDQTWLIAALGLNRPDIEVILPSAIPQRRSILAPRGD